MVRTRTFYQQLFGWNINTHDSQYFLAETTETKEWRPTAPGAINGGFLQRNPIHKTPVLVIQVKDIDAYVSQIEKAGGKVLKGKESIDSIGFSAYFEDTEGNVMCLFQPTATY